jgi:hypothetical protein
VQCGRRISLPLVLGKRTPLIWNRIAWSQVTELNERFSLLSNMCRSIISINPFNWSVKEKCSALSLDHAEPKEERKYSSLS